MRQLLCTNSGALVARMPSPTTEAGKVLVRVRCSLVSVGTELAPLRTAHHSQTNGSISARSSLARRYLGKAIRDPKKAVRKALALVKSQVGKQLSRSANNGNGSAARSPSEMDQQGWSLGYSAAGEVVAVGAGVTEFAPGDLVACAGAGQANHADYILVPKNLTCRVPANCPVEIAATTTVGAIALQGVRRATPQLGETVAVLGLGLIGQITVQLLRANGCKVLGFDLDAGRVERAKSHGMDQGSHDPENWKRLVRDCSGNKGVDRCLITAATSSDAVINQAMESTRAKGTVVIVGDVGLGVERQHFYRKEIDLLMSTSYGPGRYDSSYEDEGRDYPYAYVRWTLKRNMEAYLELAAVKKIDIKSLIDRIVPIDQAPEVYGELSRASGPLPLGVLLSYGEPKQLPPQPVDATRITLAGHGPAPAVPLHYALVGAGAFGTSTLFPILSKMSERFFLRGVVSRNAAQAGNFARSNKAEVLTSNLQDILNDPSFHLLVIATRHHEHADQVIRGLQAGKHVFVEKPLALSWQELDRVVKTYDALPEKPILQVGFNRRFAPAIQVLRRVLAERRSPLVMNYRINAGYIPLDHWVHGDQGGGRNLGEACHMYDLFRSLAGAGAVRVQAQALQPGSLPYARNDNFTATVAYEDGSIGTLVYTALGPKTGMAKERLEVFADGEAYVLDDFRTLTRAGDGKVLWARDDPDKGHQEELVRLGEALGKGGPAPIPFYELVETTAVALRVEDLLFERDSDEE